MSKPTFPITGLWVRTDPMGSTYGLQILVEHDGIWKLAVDGLGGGLCSDCPPDLVSRIIEVGGLERAPVDQGTHDELAALRAEAARLRAKRQKNHARRRR